ncbi:hypothetical protein OIO90_005518 [Microbotryomycetes sp. JL221]|nr:hypothetical protein OIO90_005518 [Microbotryomycetes sp. JL221]
MAVAHKTRPKVTISPALPEDCDTLGDIQRRAFRDNPIDVYVFGQCTTEALIKGNANRFRKAIQDPHQTVYKATTPEGRIVGIALWGRPHPFDEQEQRKLDNETPEEKHKRLRDMYPEGTDLELADSFFESFNFRIKDPHWHLKILAVDPQVHNSGAGTALLRWGCTQADRDNVDSYLEASLRAVPLYQRYGYHNWKQAGYGGPNNEMALQPMRRRPLKVEPATRDQIPLLAKLHRDAFLPTRWFQSLWGQVEEQTFLEWMQGEIGSWMDRADANGTEHVIVATRGENEIVGYAHWQQVDHEHKANKPQTAVNGERTKVAPQTYPEGTNVDTWKAFTQDMDKFVDSIKGRFWHLHILASTGAKQQTGAGKALVFWGAKRAQQQNLPVHLEGGNEAMSFYEKLGFKKCGPPVAGICGTFEDTPVKLEPITVSTPTHADFRRIAEVHRLAFWDSDVYVQNFGNVPLGAYDEWNLNRIKSWMSPDNLDKTHFVYVARRGQDGLIVGYGHWEVGEGNGGPLDSEQDTMTWPEGCNEDLAKAFFHALDVQANKIPERNLMLHQLAVDPAFPRLGIGRMILIEGMKRLMNDKVKASMYLDSTPAGKPLYESMGFEAWDKDIYVKDNKAMAVTPMRLPLSPATGVNGH